MAEKSKKAPKKMPKQMSRQQQQQRQEQGMPRPGENAEGRRAPNQRQSDASDRRNDERRR